MPMRQSQLKILAELIGNSDKSIKVDLNSDTLTLKIKRNEMYIAFGIIGIILSLLLFYFRKNSQINLEIGIIVLALSIIGLIGKQIPNKTIIFNSTTNTLIITPSFFINKWILKAIKTNQPIPFRDINKIKVIYGFINNQSRWTVYFNESFWLVILLSFTNKEKARQVADLLNEMRA